MINGKIILRVVIIGDVKDLVVGTFGYATGEILMEPESRSE